jgi:hypothetical protein
MLGTKETHETEEMYNVHCSVSLAYFIAAVGKRWALRHRTAREAVPAVNPPYQPQLTDRSATRERTKPDAINARLTRRLSKEFCSQAKETRVRISAWHPVACCCDCYRPR